MPKATYQGAMADIFSKYKKRAARVGHPFKLSWGMFLVLTSLPCYYCSRPPSNRLPRKEDFFYNGIDRKNNDLPYTIENSVPCCAICNRGKNALGYEEWISYLDNLVKYRYVDEQVV